MRKNNLMSISLGVLFHSSQRWASLALNMSFETMPLVKVLCTMPASRQPIEACVRVLHVFSNQGDWERLDHTVHTQRSRLQQDQWAGQAQA